MDPDNEIHLDFFPFIRIYKSGRTERFLGTEIVPAGIDTLTGVTSKDLLLNPSTNLTVRLYIPPNLATAPTAKLPILVYFHGGGFIIETAFSPTYHNYLNSLVAKANIVVVSVDYRRAPEHKLPAAYDDCWEALQWVSSHVDSSANPTEPWLINYGDFSRVFLAGDSAGANIVHHVAMRSVDEKLREGVKIKGVALFHPYFWGAEAVGNENHGKELKEKMEGMWRFIWPEDFDIGIDDERINPLVGGVERLKDLPCDLVLVTVAQKDILRERGWAYCEAVKKSGWKGEVKFVESEDEEHVFYLKKVEGEKTKVLLDAMVELLNSEQG